MNAGAEKQNQKKIKIVHCIGTLRLGGAEKQLTELICRLPADRFEQRLVLLQSGGGLLKERIQAAGCPIYSLGYDRKFSKKDPLSVWAMGRTLGRFIRLLRDEKPHILHGQLYWANLLSVVAGKLAGVRNIVVSHRQLASLKGKSKVLAALERWTNRHADGVLANSEAVKRDVAKQGGISESAIHRIYNGIVLENFGDAGQGVHGEGRDGIRIIMVANLHPYKGHADLLRGMKILTEKYANVRLLLVGRDQGAGEGLKTLAGDLGIADRVEIMGERTDVPALLKSADIVAHPSHQEGFSNSILEAMAAGKPLVVSDVGGNPEAVLDGENGYVVEAGDSSALASALERLIEDESLRRRMGVASRVRIENEFAIERTVAEYVRYYEELVKH